jgi:hypothetical protein
VVHYLSTVGWTDQTIKSETVPVLNKDICLKREKEETFNLLKGILSHLADLDLLGMDVTFADIQKTSKPKWKSTVKQSIKHKLF